MIRLAGAADVLPIVGMVEDLCAAVDGPMPLDRSHAAAVLSRLIAEENGAVWVSDGGFLAACLSPTVISPRPVAQELGWFAADGSGLRLLRNFEKWAIERGAAMICLSTAHDGPNLSRLGYRRAEQAWARVL